MVRRQNEDISSFFREMILVISHGVGEAVAQRVFQSEGKMPGFEGRNGLSAL